MNLSNTLTLKNDLSIIGSDWSKKQGEKVNVTYDIQNGYYGKMSGVYHHPKIKSVKIDDCDYPVSFMPENFVELVGLEKI